MIIMIREVDDAVSKIVNKTTVRNFDWNFLFRKINSEFSFMKKKYQKRMIHCIWKSHCCGRKKMFMNVNIIINKYNWYDFV